jgi:DNA-binding winged helix-turn-helix (wHTH) protein
VSAPLVLGPLELRPQEFQALVEGRRTGLTVREFQVLWALAQHPDRVVRREEIYAQVWGGAMARRDRSVDVFVRKVRQKLAVVAPGTAFVHTHFGVGYRLAPEPAGDGETLPAAPLEGDALEHVRDGLAGVDGGLQRAEDVLPANHDHRVDARVEQ